MKISTTEIMLLGNPQHPDFGTFARFITAMGTHVRFNQTTYVCNTCYHPVIVLDDDDPHNPKNQVCNYCRGKKDGLAENAIEVVRVVEVPVEFKPKDTEDFYRNHEHRFKGTGLSRHCSVCGVFENVVKIILGETDEVSPT